MTEPEVEGVRICGHCREEMRGFASAGDTWLCHPDEGLDCYRLVTVYKHAMPCFPCASVHYDEGVEDEEDLSLPPYYCEDCGHPLAGPGTSTYGVCRAGNCTTVLCGGCGKQWASFGPVGCDCQSRDPRLKSLRAMYRKRKR